MTNEGTQLKNAPRGVEGSTENPIENPRTIEGVRGLENVPRSIIPVPYYTLVQPESTKVTLPNGERADNGSFLMNDIRQVVYPLNMLVLRAKRQTRIFNDRFGMKQKNVSLNILGLNIEREKPFILNVPITSFSAFGKFFEELQDRGAENAWDYPVTATTEEIDDDKETDEGMARVQWEVIRLEVHQEKTPKKLADLANEMYLDFAEKLDRNEPDDELAEIAGKVFNN